MIYESRLAWRLLPPAWMLTNRGGPSGSPMLMTVDSCLEMAEPAAPINMCMAKT